ncbi:MAG: D-alanyl-D-alanine carboxypeptidase, partial [Candidatus Electrothrix sp. AR4]|nr:D-alanyl-D-alanine carboxypeptidase [Candidatus Electrothrix sp. AR4]
MIISMSRCSFLFLQLLAIACVSLLLMPILVQAGSVPVLRDTAKRNPQAKAQYTVQISKNEALAAPAKPTQSIVTLGCKGDISDIKSRCSVTTSSKKTYSNKVSRFIRKFRKPIRLSGINKRITSKSVMILDAKSGDTLFAKAPDNPRQPASTIKVLTGMIAMKRLKKNEKVGVSRHAERMPRSKVYLSTKKRYKANDLINAVLLASANDASVALAEKIAGSESDFAKLMTLHAQLWGAKNTICRTASGLTAKGQQSTARDLAQIFRRAMQDKEFARRMKRTKVKTSYG